MIHHLQVCTEQEKCGATTFFFPFPYFSFYLRLLNQNISDYRIKYRVYLWDQQTNWNNFSSFHTCSFLLAASKMRIHVLFSTTFCFYPGLCRREWSSEFSRRRSLWGAAFRLLSPWTQSPSCRKVYTWQKQTLQVNAGKNNQIQFERWGVQIQIFYKAKFHFKLDKQIWETNSCFSTEGCLDHFTVWRLKSNVFLMEPGEAHRHPSRLFCGWMILSHYDIIQKTKAEGSWDENTSNKTNN